MLGKTFMFYCFLIFGSELVELKLSNESFCKDLECDVDVVGIQVCGIRQDHGGFRIKLFNNDCELLKHGCDAGNNEAYGITSVEYCDKIFNTKDDKEKELKSNEKFEEEIEVLNTKDDRCNLDNCKDQSSNKSVCGIRKKDAGFAVKMFDNACLLDHENCVLKTHFVATENFICEQEANPTDVNNYRRTAPQFKSFIVIKSPLKFGNNINRNIDNFFAATHSVKFPLKPVALEEQVQDPETRRMLLKTAGPVVVFKPWIHVPKNISSDVWHVPTINTCYHKCPEKCPDTYAPVCGVPGTKAKEPTLVFKNHCYMDLAQCKMYWEDKSPTSISSIYVESSFLFCLGDELGSLYRLLALIKTLQHMGRIKQKGKFHYKFRNMRFLNDRLLRNPRIMG